MKKIPTLYVRDPENMRRVTRTVHLDCDWVINGTGVATRKWNGTCVLISGGRMYKRRDVKPGKNPPVGFQQVDEDEITGKIFGWVLVDENDPNDQWHREAFERCGGSVMIEGTYELVGPKVQGNAERFDHHQLLQHGLAVIDGVPVGFDDLRDWLKSFPGEGVVWHHEDGRMAKIKRKDFWSKSDG